MTPQPKNYALLSRHVYENTEIDKYVEIDGIRYRVTASTVQATSASTKTSYRAVARGCARAVARTSGSHRAHQPHATPSRRLEPVLLRPRQVDLKPPSYLATSLFGLALLAFHSNAYGASIKNPDAKLNPSPRMRYELTATVENAPGEFDRVSGSIDYRVSNSRCVPLAPVTGATIVPTKHLPLTFEHVAGNEYKAEIFVDLLEDEDYFGLGLCHWELVGAGMDLVAGSVDFSPSIYREDILANKKVTRYFARAAFAEKAPDERVDIGESSPSAFKDANATFSVTIRAEEHTQ